MPGRIRSWKAGDDKPRRRRENLLELSKALRATGRGRCADDLGRADQALSKLRAKLQNLAETTLTGASGPAFGSALRRSGSGHSDMPRELEAALSIEELADELHRVEREAAL